MSEVARSFGVCTSTLSRAFTRLNEARRASIEQRNPRLLERAARLTEPRSATSNRLLNDQEELAVIERLRRDFARGFTNRIIRQICFEQTRQLRSKPRNWSRCWLEGFKRRIEQRFPRNLSEWSEFLTEEWESTPRSTCSSLVNSMPDRMRAVIDAEGHKTGY